MQITADFIVRALTRQRIKAHMYLDDIVIIGATRDITNRQYQQTMDVLRDLGLQVATNKLQPPAQVVTWLGIRFDIVENELSIPDAKLAQIKQGMAAASKKFYLTKKHLQRIIGQANHLAKIVRAARVFICRILAALRAANTDRIEITKSVRADLKWFDTYLRGCNGRAIIPANRTVIRIWADACLKGAGASDGKRYYTHVYPRPYADSHHITELEALNCMAAVRAFVTTDHAGGTVEVHCDNQSAVDAMTSGRARDTALAACARAMWHWAAQTDTDIRFTHVPGEAMALPDALSRVACDEASRRRADQMIKELGLQRVHAAQPLFECDQFM